MPTNTKPSRGTREDQKPSDDATTTTTTTTTHYFAPRPEARQSKWVHLLPPVQRAVEALLLDLDAAYPTAQAGRGAAARLDQHMARTLLVTGKRGAGKTTVLVNTQYALDDPDGFFDGVDEKTPAAHSLASKVRNELAHGILWLPPLDLELVPPGANLLATLLVCLRGALDRKGSTSGSILESRTESAYDKVDRLIRDAAFLWEDVQSSDRRERVTAQVKAAEIQAGFKDQFTEAIQALEAEVGAARMHKPNDAKVVIVLPIDNVDRSIEHMRAILKLVRMVSCENLWFVLAAGRADFQMFLEHAFQRELVQDSSGALDTNRDDDFLSIARRQSAATQRKVLPPLAWVKIATLKPEEALDYHPPDEEGRAEPTLRKLLTDVKLHWPGREGAGKLPVYDLLRLFVHPTGRRRYTQVGKHALALPPREIVDWWQIARSEKDGQGEGAVRIVSEMLRQMINESDLPAWAADVLHHRLLGVDSEGKTTIDLSDGLLTRLRKVGHCICIESSTCTDDYLGSKLYLDQFRRYILELRNPFDPAVRARLPPDVGAFWMLLHDLLEFCDPPRVINDRTPGFVKNPSIAMIEHQAIVDGERRAIRLDWPAPNWAAYLDYEILVAQWLNHRDNLDDTERFPHATERDRVLLGRITRAAWIGVVSCVASKARGENNDGKHGQVKPMPTFDSKNPAKDIDAYELEALERAADLFESSRDMLPRRQRGFAARQWTEELLPALFAPTYAPGLPIPTCLSRPSDKIQELVAQWARKKRLVAFLEAEHLRYALWKSIHGVRALEEADRRAITKDVVALWDVIREADDAKPGSAASWLETKCPFGDASR